MSKPIDKWWEQSFPLVEAAKEMKAADAAYRRMVQIGIHDFHDYDRAWREFLHCIDRAWNKTRAEARGRKNWQRIESECQNLRTQDPLLKYLVHARNVSEHTIDPIVREWEPNFRATPIGAKVRLEWDEWDRPLLPIVDRGARFNPPKKHLGKKWSHYRVEGVSEPRTAAEQAMQFYVRMLNRVSAEVYPGGHT